MLDSLRQDALERVPETIEQIEAETDSGSLDRLVRSLCHDFEVLAVASLLVDGKPETFFLNLCRSGENCKRYLEHTRLMQWPSVPVTFTAPLVGVVAVGEWKLATELANLISLGAKRLTDYDDEYLYARLLVELVRSGGRNSEAVESTVTELADVDQGMFTSRGAVVRALLAADASMLDEAFGQAIADRGNMIDEQSRMLTVDQRQLEPHKHVWLEGLALLRLAEVARLDIRDDYLYCPPLARLRMEHSYVGDWAVTFRQ